MKVTKATAYALHALMYMVRHMTELPITVNSIAKAEGIPLGYLSKIFGKLVKANFVKVVRGGNKGYVFCVHPEEIKLNMLIEAIEGKPLFEECPLKHCECNGTAENCFIYAKWLKAVDKINHLFNETSLADAAWNHPEHRFDS